MHQTNDDNVRYRWLYYNVDNGNWYMLTNWQKSEWLNWVPDAGHYWLRVEARLSNGKNTIVLLRIMLINMLLWEIQTRRFPKW